MHLGGFKKTRKRKNTLVLLEEEYFLVLKEIEKIERWLNIIDDAEKIIRTEFILQTMDRQKEQLNKVKSEYIDYKFDPKFKKIRNKQFNFSNKELKDYENKIIESYIQYLLDNLKTMENLTDDDAILINFLYLDIENFIEEFLNIHPKQIKIPLIQYIRENIIEDDEQSWVLCSNCGERTYRDFKTCIHCKYPNEVR